MFIAKYLKYSFDFPKLLTHFDQKLHKIIIYFIFLSLVYLLPMNIMIVRENGWRIDFIHQDFMDEIPTWNLPENCKIEMNRLLCSDTSSYTFNHQNVEYIFNGNETDLNLNVKQIILTKENILYADGRGNKMISRGYEGFETLNFNTFNLLSDVEKETAFKSFAMSIESSFSPWIVLYSLLMNTLVNVFIQFIFVLALGLILQLFRFGYQSFPTYIEGLKFIVLAMGLPVLIGLIVGIIQPAFGSVFFQLFMGVTIMIVMIKYGKEYIK